MAKTNKTYQYYRISYSKSQDAYSTWVYVGPKKFPDWDDFGMEITVQCVQGIDRETGEPIPRPGFPSLDDEHMFIHYSILSHISQAMRLGYDVSFCDKPEEEDK